MTAAPTLNPTGRSLAQLPHFDLEQAVVVRAPERPEAGYWVGCPSVLVEPERGRILMTYRERRPRGAAQERGWRCTIAESSDGVHFNDVWQVEKGELETSSMERFSLLPEPDGDGYLLYLSYVDPEDSRWRIDVCESDSIAGFDVAQRKPVLTAAMTQTEGVKDPYTMRVGPATYLYASFAAARSFDAEERAAAHASADIYVTGMTTFPTGLGVSQDGRDFEWRETALGVGAGWDRYQARITSVLPAGSMFLACYDGSGNATENYEESIGVAVSADLARWTSLTPQRPWASRTTDRSLRYADVVTAGDGPSMYFEQTRPDGAHELVVTGALL